MVARDVVQFCKYCDKFATIYLIPYVFLTPDIKRSINFMYQQNPHNPLSTDIPKVVIILTVKPDYLPKTTQNYARIEVVWKYNEIEKIKQIVPGELSEITDDDEDEDNEEK